MNMVWESLRTASGILRNDPALWLPGLAAGLLSALDLVLQFQLGSFMAMRLSVLEAVVFPFFIAAILSRIAKRGDGLVSFGKGAASCYFRVLLPSLVIFFGIMLTLVLLAVPLTLIGAAEAFLPVAVMGTMVPILFFTFFYDTAAVFEDKGVFESIRRSVEVVLNHAWKTVGFYAVSLLIVALVGFPLAIAWTGLLYDRLLPLTTMTTTDVQALTAEQFNTMLGFDGIVISAIFLFIAISLLFPILYAFKAVFYRSCSEKTVIEVQGEYDKKGRWYKY